MTSDQKEPFRSRSSSREFLLYKTDAKPRDEKTDDTLPVKSDELRQAYPEMHSGKAFIDYAMAELENSSKFIAMVIRIDDTGATQPGSGLRIDLAQTVDTACRDKNGLWGQLESNTLGCFFPETDETSAPALAQNIQRRLAERRDETVSMGIAAYPAKDFHKHQILENARKALDHAAFFGPNSSVLFDAVSLNISGDTYYQNQDINGAINEFKTALSLAPSNVNVHNSLGVCFGVLGDYDKARAEFEEVLRIDPAETMAVYNLGLVSLLTGNKKEALGYFLEAYGHETEIFEVAFQAGKLYLEMEQSEKAKPFFEKAVELKPESGLTCRYLGDCCVSLNLVGEAVAAYKKAIRQNPNDADSLSALGYLFDLQGENPEITTIFCQQSIDISPDNGLFRYRLGSLYLKRNQLEDALEQFQKADELGHDAKTLIQKVQKLMSDAG
ncbi:MAG: tetratricopeptide repeat protein [Proteobacteria bacterium]|nr:tetratricopeptide repeat protein [Pseudomonadota bacterium]